MKHIKEFLLVVWQFPQILIGQILLHKYGICHFINTGYVTYYYSNAVKGGLALGPIVIINASQYRKENALARYTAKKSFGFAMLSEWFGWFYIIIIGVPYLVNKYIVHKEMWFGEKWARNIMGIK